MSSPLLLMIDEVNSSPDTLTRDVDENTSSCMPNFAYYKMQFQNVQYGMSVVLPVNEMRRRDGHA